MEEKDPQGNRKEEPVKRVYGKPFVSGDPRSNLTGRPPMDKEIREFKGLQRVELTQTFADQIRMVRPNLEAILNNPCSTIKELGIAKSLIKWIDSGQFQYVQPYIEYIFGKPREFKDDDTQNKVLRLEIIDATRKKLEDGTNGLSATVRVVDTTTTEDRDGTANVGDECLPKE